MLIVFTDKEIQTDALISRAVKEYCEFYGVDNFDFIIERTEGKKPRLNPEKLFFNVSHSNSRTVCAVSDKNVGIDIQYNDSKIDFEAISEKYLGEKIIDIKTFYEYYAKAEATAKLEDSELVKKLKIADNGGQIIKAFKDYTLAVNSIDTSVYLMELYD